MAKAASFQAHDLTAGEPIPGAPFDLVYARLLLFHLPQRAEVLARLWDAVAPGGHLVVQDYDIRGISVLPALASVGELARVVTGAFHAVGADVHVGARLPQLFVDAGIGYPDGTDVAGRLEPLATGSALLERTFRSVLPTAVAHGITTEVGAAASLASVDPVLGQPQQRQGSPPTLVPGVLQAAGPGPPRHNPVRWRPAVRDRPGCHPQTDPAAAADEPARRSADSVRRPG